MYTQKNWAGFELIYNEPQSIKIQDFLIGLVGCTGVAPEVEAAANREVIGWTVANNNNSIEAKANSIVGIVGNNS